MTNKHFETSWKTGDGLKMYAQGWEPDSPNPAGVFCLVHGVGEHSSRYRHVADAFTAAGYAMFTFDLRGHGKSEGLRGHFPSADHILHDIDLLLENASNRYPGTPLILYGHSLGGILVLYYSLKRKPDLKGILATSPGLHTALEKQPLKILAARILGTITPTITMPSGLDDNGLSHDKAVIQQYRQDQLVHDRLSVGFGKVMIGVIDWTLSHAGKFSLPLLLIHGKEDSIAYPESSSEFAAQVNQNCQLVLWEEGYHELHNEPFKEEVFFTMISWANTILADPNGR